MKKQNILTALVFVFHVIYATSQNTFTALGGNFSVESSSMSYSVGQINTLQMQSSLLNLSGGIQQPYDAKIDTNISENFGFSVETYPIPSNGNVTIQINKTNDYLSYCLYNVNGVLLKKEKITYLKTNINLSLPSVYLLTIVNRSNIIKSVVIINN